MVEQREKQVYIVSNTYMGKKSKKRGDERRHKGEQRPRKSNGK